MNCCNEYGKCTRGPGCPLGPAPTADNAEARALQADRDINAGKDSGRFDARRDAAVLNQQIQRQGVVGGAA